MGVYRGTALRHASDFPGLWWWCREVPVIRGAGRQREDRGEGLWDTSILGSLG